MVSIRSKLSLCRHTMKKHKTILWNLASFVSVLLVLGGTVYAGYNFSSEIKLLSLPSLIFALVIYCFNYCLQLIAWHYLAVYTLGVRDFRLNVESIVRSDLVKYLPTSVWYIANRTHVYEKKGLAKQTVVTASLLEALLFVLSGLKLSLIVMWLNNRLGTLFFLLTFSILLLIVIPLLHYFFANKQISNHLKIRYLYFSTLIYSVSWLIGCLFFFYVIQSFSTANWSQFLTVCEIWLLAGIAGFVVSISLGFLGLAREITLSALVAQYWSLPVGVLTAFAIKLILTIGQVFCALTILQLINYLERKEAV